MPQTGEILSEAYELIEEGNPAQARALLEPLLEREPTNQDALWIYAHAAKDPQSGRDTLLKLYQINPDYPGLAPLLNELNIPIPSEVRRPIATVTREPVLDPGIGDTNNEPVSASATYEDDLEKNETENGRGRSLLYLILAGLIVVVVVLLLLNAINSMSPEETPATSEPQVAADSTVTTAPAEVTETSEEASDEPTATEALISSDMDTDIATNNANTLEQDLSGIADLLSEHELADNGIALSDTSLGTTLIINICTLPGPEASSEMSDIFETIASQPDETLGGATAVGVGLTDCETNTVLRTIGVSLADARNFADDTIDSRAFEALWQPV